jgi:RNA 2',3'-cyclic 3'-phosphodiesterase
LLAHDRTLRKASRGVRLFIALEVSEEVRARVAEAVAREKETVDAKWSRLDGLHLTLVFFGEQPPEKLKEIVRIATGVAAHHGRMRLQIQGAATFGGKLPRVLWLGVEGATKPLSALAAELGVALGIVNDHPLFTPHLTLARSVAANGDAMLNEVATRLGKKKFGAWDAERLTVYETAGGRYRALATIPLEG